MGRLLRADAVDEVGAWKQRLFFDCVTRSSDGGAWNAKRVCVSRRV